MKRHQQKPHKSISWPDVYFTAEASRERFEDVQVITLKSFIAERAYEQAIREYGLVDDTALRNHVQTILNSGALHVMEHVEVKRDNIRVVIDCENVNDETVWTALDMVASALDQLSGQTGIIYFGTVKTYSAADIEWINVH